MPHWGETVHVPPVQEEFLKLHPPDYSHEDPYWGATVSGVLYFLVSRDSCVT